MSTKKETKQTNKEKETNKKTKKVTDPSKAGFVLPEPGEIKEIIEGKRRQFIIKQYNYRELWLSVQYKNIKMSCMREVIDKALEEEKDHVEWLSVKYPISLMKMEYNLENHEYSKIMRQTMWARDELVKEYKLEMSEILDIEQKGKYVTKMRNQNMH